MSVRSAGFGGGVRRAPPEKRTNPKHRFFLRLDLDLLGSPRTTILRLEQTSVARVRTNLIDLSLASDGKGSKN